MLQPLTEQKVETAPDRDEDRPNQCSLIHVFAKGDVIPLKPQVIWQVRQGLVKLSTLCDGAEEVLVGLVKPSMAFGADLTSLQVYQAIAMTEVHLVSISGVDIEASNRLSQTLLRQINQRLQQTESLLAVSGQRQVKDRLHHLLLLLKQEIGEKVDRGTLLCVRLTHQDLANACSTTRVTITRLMGKLQQQGKIALDQRNHIILTGDEFDAA
jgi:CRP-like cAMP-binding protein